MSDIIYINEEEGKKRVMNNSKLYVRLLTKFRESTRLDGLLTLAAAGDWEKAQAEAHTIKGVAANLAFTELFNRSLDVETQLKGKSVRPESLEGLQTCFAETLVHIDEVIARNA